MKEKRSGSFWLAVTLTLYILTVIWYTVLQRPVSFQTSKYELFWSYKEWLNGDIALGKQVLANIAMFVPFGLLLSLLMNQHDKNKRSIHKSNSLILITIEQFGPQQVTTAEAALSTQSFFPANQSLFSLLR